MNNTKQTITDMVEGMNFKRKKPVSKETKQKTQQLLSLVGKSRNKLDKLHLKLWYAVEKNDYHSVCLTEAMQELEKITHELESLM